MKRFIFCLVALVCSASQSVFGSIDISPSPQPVAGNWVDFGGGSFRQGSGGPFLGRLASSQAGLPTSTNTWYTFCVETDGGSEEISLGNPNAVNYATTLGPDYRVVSTSQYVATATQNTVTNAAKYIYYAYGHDLLAGMLAGYTNTAAKNELVQKAIWSLVVKTDGSADPNDYSDVYNNSGEAYWLNIGSIGSGAAGTIRELREAAIAAVGNAANLALAARIQILNPDNTFPAEGVQLQSMLYEIPEAATIVVWSMLGLIGMAAGRRQRA